LCLSFKGGQIPVPIAAMGKFGDPFLVACASAAPTSVHGQS
jgi:hypothetical protein